MVDLDELFSYQTLQVVRVKDRRLGIIYYLCTIGIGIYIAWSIITDQLYLKKEPPAAGSIRVSFLQPTSWTSETDLSYCNGGVGTKAGVSCAYVPAQVASPRLEEGAAFVTTRMSVTQFDRPCADPHTNIFLVPPTLPSTPECAITAGTKTSFFFADIEQFTMQIEHTVQTSSDGMTFRGQDMEGRLLDSHGEMLTKFDKDAAKGGDIITVGKALEAANVNIDDLTDVPGSNPADTLRYDGVVLVMYISYYVSPANSSELMYDYKLNRVAATEFKYEEPQYAGLETDTVTIFNRHGVRIVIKQTGYIGRFDMMSLLVNIVAATALLRVAVFIVEFFMISILPDRKLYKRAKVHTTEDFSEIRDKRKDSTNSPEEKELQIVSSTRSESPQIQSPPRAQIAAHPSPAPMHSVSVPGQIVMMPPGYHQPQPSGFIPAQQSMYPGQRY